ncbi:MAG: anaerobic sulfatase maturase [Deltaproteobacteria bacterium]|nr:anaerobic sulfatase maturase [Deltaproteobacteria bacterium]MBW2181941.1 anaerobic sulfatase maturase [Deltaproteobacteria bacterium]
MRPNVLSFLVKPTSYACNIECDYCFYKRVESMYGGDKPFMKIATAEAFIQKALSMGIGLNTFCWQGGEPTLLGIEFYKQVVEFQKKYCLEGQIIENSIQTNGILINEKWCRFLKENNFLVGISLDGPAEIHNTYRKFSNGRGTFDKVMKAIRLMEKRGVDFNILTLLTDVNIKSPEILYRFFRKNKFNFLQFINCFEYDKNSTGLSNYSVRGDAVGEFYVKLFDLWIKDGFPHVSIRLFEDMLIYLIDGVHVSCCWMDQCGAYTVVEYNGDCYPCDFFVYPQWKLGNILENKLETILENPLRKQFSNMKSQIAEECKACELAGFCNGDCTKFRDDGRKSFSGISEYCSSWKAINEKIQPHVPRIRQKAMEVRNAPQQKQDDKIGRNQPCPCGSGKKYKYCCG